MFIGAIMSGHNDLEFSPIGYFWMTLNCFIATGNIIFMRYASKNLGVPKFGMVFYNNLISGVLLLIFIFMLDAENSFSFYNSFTNLMTTEFIMGNFLAGICGFYLNFAALWCVGATSASTMAVAGTVNRVPLIIVGYLLFGAQITNQGYMFMVFAVIGGFMYAYAKQIKPDRGTTKE